MRLDLILGLVCMISWGAIITMIILVAFATIVGEDCLEWDETILFVVLSQVHRPR